LDIAVAIPVVLTLGLLTYAVSVLAVPADPSGAGSVKELPQAAAVPVARPEQLRGSVNEATTAPQATAPQPSKESPRITAHVPPAVIERGGSSAAQPGFDDRTGEIGPINAAAVSPLRDVQIVEDARAVQRRLSELGHFSGAVSGVWGPVSRAALRSFKEANGLAQDMSWDAETERSLFRSDAPQAEPFVGRWAADVKACSHKAAKNGHVPTIIETSRARAGDATCSFTDKRQVGSTWRFAAQCASGAEKWTAHIELAVLADRLTWTSERGAQVYVRCQQPVEITKAGPPSARTTIARLR
jgi:hypothetical protein